MTLTQFKNEFDNAIGRSRMGKMKDEYSPAFEELGRRILWRVTDLTADSCMDEWCQEIMEMAEKLGLVRSEPYDPDNHNADAEPGDMIFTWRHLPQGWRTTKPAVEVVDVLGNPISDPNHCGFLRINDPVAYAKMLKGKP